MAECLHLPDYAGEVCSSCGEEIDQYGNTESDFNACSFPDCGCDGARLCMAGSASERALTYNVENMYCLPDPRPRMRFAGAFYEGEFEASDATTPASSSNRGDVEAVAAATSETKL